MNYDDILQIAPFGLKKDEKSRLFDEYLRNLCLLHYEKCSEYKKIIDRLKCDIKGVRSYYELPFLPVRLFKEFELKSTDEIFKTMTSSGTSGQAVSKIYIDKITASNQQKTLVKIVSDFTRKSRLPMLIIDSPSVIKNRAMFSARGAAILGFSIFGTDKTYALNDDMSVNLDAIEAFLQRHKNEQILLFGFTFVIWQYFYKALCEMRMNLGLENAILIHGGGWKKLINEAVSKAEFKRSLKEICGINRVCDYYGMIEQTGCIYMECECGNLHASVFSDIIIRNARDFSVAKHGEKGLVQVCSLLPSSYPGHLLLSEDEGVILGEDDCACGRKGKYFEILGRVKNAELRGCSDTYERH